MLKKLTQETIMRALDWAYEKAITGMGGFDKASDLAMEFQQKANNAHAAADMMVRLQAAKAASSGFVTGLGGFMSLPVAIPANLASVLYLQVRMIAAIAHMGGYDLRDNKVKSFVLMCLAGNVAKDVMQEIGIKVGTRITEQLVLNISEKTIININERIGFKLLSQYGSKGLINLSKLVPLAGGVIGGSIDLTATIAIGRIAKKVFLPPVSIDANQKG